MAATDFPVDAALSAPTTAMSRRWVFAFSLAAMGTFVGFYGPLQILLAKQADQFAPASKESVLALVALLGAAVSGVANPIWGALSDRTTSRFGRRIPWIAFGTVGGVAGLLLLAAARDVGTMIAGWCLVQGALNAPFAALSAAVPDQVPIRQRGAAGGFFGMAQTFGVIGGTGLAVAGRSIVGGYLACAAFVLLAAVPYLVLRKDIVQSRAQLTPWSWRRFLTGFWISPRVYPDFGWAWLTRFLMNLGNGIALLYLLFFLSDAVHYPDPATGVLVLTLLYAAALLITVLIAGYWSDRAGKRRIFVTGAGLVMAVAALVLAGWETWPGALLAATVFGVGFGTYTSVDFALITQVLPKAVNRARDLGVLNIANSLPQVLAPVIAAPIVRQFGGYPALYLASAVVGLAGAVLVYRVKSVR